MKYYCCLIILFCCSFNIEAISIVVNSTNDMVDANIGDGTCMDASGNCTLRAALQEVNASTDLTNNISLPSGTYTLTINGINENNAASGDLDCRRTVDIVGANARTTIIDANNIDRVFHIITGDISLSKLTLINGSSGRGGGIFNTDNLNLSEVSISSCTSSAGLGGGIYSTSGILNISSCTISSNIVSGEQGTNGVFPGGGGGGGGGAGLGGGIYNNNSTVNIVNSTISGNMAQGGRGGNGSHHASSGTVASPGGSGGGLNGGNGGGTGNDGSNGGWASGGGGGGSLSGDGGNGGFGGGGGAGGANSWGGNAGPGGAGGNFGGNANVMCCSASGGGGGGAGLGGGIFNRSGSISLENVTIASNTVSGGGGGGGYWYTSANPGQGVAGGVFNRNGIISIQNSIVAGNSSATSSPDIYGAVTSNGYNIIQSIGGAVVSGVTTGNILGQSPNLQPLANNGGETDTHSFNCVDIAYNSGQTSSATDQIGNARPFDNTPDIGALEINFNLGFKR